MKPDVGQTLNHDLKQHEVRQTAGTSMPRVMGSMSAT